MLCSHAPTTCCTHSPAVAVTLTGSSSTACLGSPEESGATPLLLLLLLLPAPPLPSCSALVLPTFADHSVESPSACLAAAHKAWAVWSVLKGLANYRREECAERSVTRSCWWVHCVYALLCGWCSCLSGCKVQHDVQWMVDAVMANLAAGGRKRKPQWLSVYSPRLQLTTASSTSIKFREQIIGNMATAAALLTTNSSKANMN